MDDDGDKKTGDEATGLDEGTSGGERIDDRPVPEDERIPQKELEQILSAHETWVETAGKEGARADLSRAYLEAANLEGACLNGANLEGAILRRANLEGAILMDANLQHADLIDANLQGADLIHTKLQGAKLGRANLQEAILEEASLQGADLRFAELQGAYLIDANLQGATLFQAKLQGAKLQGATLQGAELSNAIFEAPIEIEKGTPTDEWAAADLTGADLRHSDLSDAQLFRVTGLLADRLAGANLSNAKLPPDIAKFEALAQVTEISKHARNNFLAVLGACVFSWLTIATTTDLALLINRAETALPMVAAKVPIAGFYWAAPAILLALLIYLHLYLQRMWSALATLPAVFPEGHTLDRRAYPWLLTCLVNAHVPRLKERRPPFSRQMVLLSIGAAWFLVPVTIGFFWLRYLPRHDWIGTGVQVLMLAMAGTLAVAYYRRARTTLRGHQPPNFAWRTAWKRATTFSHCGFFLLFAAALATISLGAIEGKVIRAKNWESILQKDAATWVPYAFISMGFRTYADLREADVSTKPSAWTGLAERAEEKLDKNLLEKARAEFSQVKGALLKGADLRDADAVLAFLAKADLRYANLRGANLSRANLQGADLSRGNLQEANFSRGNLQEANLSRTTLLGANLSRADLREADISRADLQGASLQQANLLGASFFRGNLQGAYLQQANLRRADLRWADLRRANLGGAVFGKSSRFVTDLTDADLTSSKGLTQKQLDKACGDESTKLPPGLSIKPCKQATVGFK